MLMITHNERSGMSVVEIILASALFMLVATNIVTLILQSYTSNRLSNEQTVATQYAAEGVEAARSIQDLSFASLVASTGTGAAIVNNVWAFVGTSTVFDKYTRVLTVTSTQRDPSGNIVASGGTVDTDTKKVVSTVTWQRNPTFSDSVALTAYLTNWRSKYGGGGMLVYGDGGTTADTILYRTLSAVTGLWSATSTAADVTTTSTNQYLRAVRLFSSPTRNEKIMISRHYDGTSQYIYAQVYNGTSSTWGNVIRLSSWSAATFLDVQNFSGTYLANGNFMAVYSDNTVIPKSVIWNGTSWAVPVSLTTLGGSNIPNFIVAKARPGTSEVMAAFFTQATSTITEYNGTSTWSAITTHTTSSPINTKRFVDFDWVQGTTSTIGALAYTTSTTAKAIYAKIFQANGAGGGSWGAGVAAATQSSTVAALAIAGGANQFQMCDKDAGVATSTIQCYNVTYIGTTATVAKPTNSIIATTTDSGIQRSYHLDFESSGNQGVLVYSDTTIVPKLKMYTTSTATWAAAPTAISTSPFTAGVIKTVRAIPYQNSDDIMLLMADANLDLYSAMWDGAANAMATTTAGRVFAQHGINGSATADLWYDFAWNTP